MKGGYPDVLVIASGFFSTAAFLPLLRYDSECRTVHDIDGIAVMLQQSCYICTSSEMFRCWPVAVLYIKQMFSLYSC